MNADASPEPSPGDEPGPTGSGPQSAPGARPAPWARKAAGFAVGLALLGAAVWVAVAHESTLRAALHEARYAPAWLIGLSLGLPVLNWLVTSAVFVVLNAPHARVPVRETAALVAVAGALNYLPMRPGMLGRVAYHKRYHGIGVGVSAKIIVLSVVLNAVALGVLAATALVLRGAGGAVVWAVVCAGTLLAMVAGAVAARAAARPTQARLLAVLALKYADSLIWAGRYAAVFALVGHPISLPEAVAFACVSQAAAVVPLAGNGLGLREWGVGLLASLLPSARASGEGWDAAAVGLSADLVHRGLEVAVALVLAVGAGALLLRGRPWRRSPGAE